MPPKISKSPTHKKSSSGKIEIIPNESINHENSLKVLVYGESGTGKTTFWGSWPKPILALVCSSQGLGELLSVSNIKDIDSVHIKSSSDVEAAIEHHENTFGKYKTIVLDHATGLQDLVLKEVLDLEESPTQLSWGIASQQQWGQIANVTKSRLRTLLSVQNTHVVINCQEKVFQPEDTTSGIQPHVLPALSPSVVNWVDPACDFIFQTFKKKKIVKQKIKIGKTFKEVEQVTDEIDYHLRTGPDAVYITKFRIPKDKAKTLPNSIVDPTFEKINSLINGESNARPVKKTKRRSGVHNK